MDGSGLSDLYAMTQLKSTITTTMSMLRWAAYEGSRVCVQVIPCSQRPFQDGAGAHTSPLSQPNIATQSRQRVNVTMRVFLRLSGVRLHPIYG